jgi:hypothetical protein
VHRGDRCPVHGPSHLRLPQFPTVEFYCLFTQTSPRTSKIGPYSMLHTDPAPASIIEVYIQVSGYWEAAIHSRFSVVASGTAMTREVSLALDLPTRPGYEHTRIGRRPRTRCRTAVSRGPAARRAAPRPPARPELGRRARGLSSAVVAHCHSTVASHVRGGLWRHRDPGLGPEPPHDVVDGFDVEGRRSDGASIDQARAPTAARAHVRG